MGSVTFAISKRVCASSLLSWSSSSVSADLVKSPSRSIFRSFCPFSAAFSTIRVVQAMCFAVWDLVTVMGVDQHMSLSGFQQLLNIQSVSIISAVLDNEVFSWLDRRPHHDSKGFFGSLSVLEGDPSQ